MREFNELEKHILQHFYSTRDVRLTVSENIENIFGNQYIIHIKKQEDKNPNYEVYCKKDYNPWIGNDIFDFISFLDEMEECKFVILTQRSDSEEYNCLHGYPVHERYDIKYYNKVFYLSTYYEQKLIRQLRSTLIPTYALVSLVENNFKTPEQKRFEQEISEAKKQTKYSRCAFYVAIGAFVISFITLLITIYK